jgi:putative ribosome biogenesis GTPase RsgA
MNLHKFAVGDRVSFVAGKFDTNVTRGTYLIVRTLPRTNQGVQYRVKNALDNHERVLDEDQLRAI